MDYPCLVTLEHASWGGLSGPASEGADYIRADVASKFATHDPAEFEEPAWFSCAFHDEYANALSDLTARRAYSKSSCAILIAEKAIRVKELEQEVRDLKERLKAAGRGE